MQMTERLHCDTLSTMVARRGRQDEGEELLNKLFLFYFFFEHKKCSRNFVKLWLNP